ncbi:MAG: ATP-binding cassette domain-containing protein, partial [Hyphomicrobiaceae bacterium]
MIELQGVAKTFTMHLRGGARLPVVSNVSFTVEPGECVVLGGRSGAGKSSILKMIYGNYRIDTGHVRVRGPAGWVDM